jgi:hypothetical protein
MYGGPMRAFSSLTTLATLATVGTLPAAAASAAPAGLTPTPIPPGCPWHELSLYGLPNVNWCEETLCAVVNEPANAYSNLAYVLVALGMWALGRKLRAPTLRQFAPAAALVGIASFIYHASNTYLTQVLDFLGMYVFCFLLLLLNVERLGWLGSWAARRSLPLLVLAMTALTAFVAPLGFPIQSLIGLLILCIVVTETLLRRRAVYSLQNFGLSLLLLTAGAVCSVLDVSRRLCDPTNHVLQGHAAWHVLSALSLLCAFLHYRQFDAELTRAD